MFLLSRQSLLRSFYCFFQRYQRLLRSWNSALDQNQIVVSVNLNDLQILNSHLSVSHVTRHLLALEYLAGIGTCTVGTGMTMIFGTVGHRSSGLTVTLDGALESFTFGNSRGIDLVAFCEDVGLDLILYGILFCVIETELSDIALVADTGLVKMAF